MSNNSTSVLSNSSKNEYTRLSVVVIGEGPFGIAAGCKLIKDLNLSDFKIFDRQNGLGGTWQANRYPGVACDVPTHLFSFSFAPNYTSKSVYPSGSDYIGYLEKVVREYGIADKIQFETEVRELRWIEETQEWECLIQYPSVHTGVKEQEPLAEEPTWSRSITHEIIRSRIVISATGILTQYKALPADIPGQGQFKGRTIHSANWPDQLDLEDKNVAVVGTGASAAQIVPSLLKGKVKSLTQIMRTPPWIHPRLDEPGGREA